MKISEYIQHFNEQLESPFDFKYRPSSRAINVKNVGQFLLATVKTPFCINISYTEIGELRPWIACTIPKRDSTLEQDIVNIEAFIKILNSQLDTYKVLFL